MSDSPDIPPGLTRQETYRALLPQIRSLIESEPDTIATLANVSAALHQAFAFHWVGFYLVKADQLVLGPFQGPVACTRINKGKGVCGAAWQQANTLIVPDVDAFPGHIACSSLSKSEIVVPLFDGAGKAWAVLDIDSDQHNDFSDTDREALEQLASWLSR